MANAHEDRCADCGRKMPLHLLDAVLLDERGSKASEALYCKTCWPRHKKIEGDEWREGYREAAR